MKTHKIKLIIFACMFAIVTFVFGAYAQNKSHDPESHAKRQTEMMKTKLSLNAEQAAKIESINLKYAQKSKAQREEMHKSMQTLREDKDKETGAVLTKEQMDKYNALKAEYKNKRMKHHKDHKKDCGKKREEGK
jgi:Spy/CpxP family protein refolding chaperone